jgi:hypothetical protein
MRPTINVRPSEAEKARWREAAAAAGESLHAWVRRAANEAAALEEAIRRERERAEAEHAHRQEELNRIAFP